MAQVLLIDVPGSGSGRRPIRDGYLRVEELDAVDTALFFLESRPSSVQDSRVLQDLMQAGRRTPEEIRDSVLVVAGKFDTLQNAPGMLLAPETQQSLLSVPPDEAELLDHAPPLSELVTAARSLLPRAQDERIFFVSPIATMALADGLHLGWNVSDVTARLGISQEIDTARDRIRAWRAVGAPPSKLGAALAAFTVDGGLQALRAAMAEHAVKHGVGLRLRRVILDAENLRRDYEHLERRRAEFGPVVTADADVRILFNTVLGRISGRVAELYDVIPQEFADPHVALRVGTSSPGKLVRQEAVQKVFGWPQWKLLFDSVEDGLVVAVQAKGRDPERAKLFEEARFPVPIDVADFLTPFTTTCVSIQERTPERVSDRVKEYLRAVVLVTREERNMLGGVLTRDVRARVTQEKGGPLLLWGIDQVTDLDQAAAAVLKALDERPAPEGGTVEGAFPLDPTRAFPWHPDSPRRDRHDYCGTPQLLRLRQEMTTAVIAACERVLVRHQNKAAELLQTELADIREALTSTINDGHRWIRVVTDLRGAATSTTVEGSQ